MPTAKHDVQNCNSDGKAQAQAQVLDTSSPENERSRPSSEASMGSLSLPKPPKVSPTTPALDAQSQPATRDATSMVATDHDSDRHMETTSTEAEPSPENEQVLLDMEADLLHVGAIMDDEER